MDIRRAFVALAAVALVFGVTPAAVAQDPELPPVEEQAAPETQIADGELLSVDTEARTISVRAADGSEMQFSYTDATEITGATDDAAGLATETGSQVTVHYTSEAGVNTATRIEVGGVAEGVVE